MEFADIINTFLALIFVLALMGLIAILAKKLGLSQSGFKSNGKRLKIIESLALDTRRRAVILRCDDKEHLVILSSTGETVVSENMVAKIEPLEDSEKPFE